MDTNETVVKKFHPHPFYFLGFYFGGVLFLVLGLFLSPILIVVGVLVFVLGEITRRAETFYILESGVAREYRLLTTSREYTEYGAIQNLKVKQSFVDNIFGIGSIHIDTAGGDKTEVNFHGIIDPYGIERIIREKIK